MKATPELEQFDREQRKLLIERHSQHPELSWEEVQAQIKEETREKFIHIVLPQEQHEA